MKSFLPVCGCLLLLVSMAFTPPQKKKGARRENIQYKQPGSPLPEFRVYTLGGEMLSKDSVAGAGHLILMLFNPTCDHCGMVTDTLLRYYNGAQKSRLLLVAGDNMMPYLPAFAREHHLEKYPAVQVGVDSSNLIQKTFLYEPLPQVNIYDSTGRLIRILTGIQPGEIFLPYLK